MDNQFIKEQFRRAGYRVSRTARALDLDYDAAKQLLTGGEPAPLRGPTEPRPADIRQLGKIGLRPYVIAVKAVTDSEWPEDFGSTIHAARLRYDAGTHDMFQETRDGWNILYSRKLKRPTPPRPYFTKREIFA